MTREEILGHIYDKEWLRSLILQQMSSGLKPILKDYRFYQSDLDEDHPEKEESYYPEKGVLLYSFDPEGRESGQRGYERNLVYLLETGCLALVNSRTDNSPVRVSFEDWAASNHTWTRMSKWDAPEIEKNKERVVDALLRLLD